jgi:hypothetical protein
MSKGGLLQRWVISQKSSFDHIYSLPDAEYG